VLWVTNRDTTRHSYPTIREFQRMALSVFDLFKVGIGPSSSHTVGPMIAARWFASALIAMPEAGAVVRVKIDLLGSLGATGKGHGSDKAVLLGVVKVFRFTLMQFALKPSTKTLTL